MENGSKIVVAALAGAAAGALAGILFAPAKGSETRRMIGDKYSALRGRVTDAREDLADRFQEVKARFEDSKEAIKDDVREKLLIEIQKLEEKLAKA